MVQQISSHLFQLYVLKRKTFASSVEDLGTRMMLESSVALTLFPQSLRIKMNQFNFLHVYEPPDPPREYNSQPPEIHLKSSTSPPKTSPVISDIMGIIHHHAIDNSDVEVNPSEYPFESTSESGPDPDTTPIKSIDDYEMDYLLEFFHS